MSLSSVFRLCEDSEDEQSLKIIFQIFKFLINIQQANLIEVLMSDQYYLSTFGALEYNPDNVQESSMTKYRHFLQNVATFK